MLIVGSLAGDRRTMKDLARTRDVRAMGPIAIVLERGESDAREAAAIVMKVLWRALHSRIRRFLCPAHVTRFQVRTTEIGASRSKIRYAVCRKCGQPWPIKEVRDVVVVLDHDMEQEQVEDREVLRVRWTPNQPLFDFDRVEIHRATETDVEWFVMRVLNDEDAFRRARYRNIPWTVDSKCHMAEASFRRLAGTFSADRGAGAHDEKASVDITDWTEVDR